MKEKRVKEKKGKKKERNRKRKQNRNINRRKVDGENESGPIGHAVRKTCGPDSQNAGLGPADPL